MSATLIPMATYVLVANPATYKFVRGILGNWVASADGVATLAGLVLHAFVYVFLTGLVLMMFMPRGSGYAPGPSNSPAPAPAGMMQQAQAGLASGLKGLASMVAPK